MNLRLILPSKEHEAAWYNIVEEIEKVGEKVTPYALNFHQNDFHVFLEKTLKDRLGIDLGDFVPATTYFLMGDHNDRILGAISIRHRLNDDLLFRGGNIGYGIRPSERRKGFAAQMLSLAIDKCREMEFEKVLVTCNQDNIGSAKTIMKNGGILENEVTEENGNIVQRYWIIL